MKSWHDSLTVYADRRVLSLVFLGFASGLPLALVYATLAAWLADSGVSLKEIGFVSLVGLAYSLKFLWSPLVDRLDLPVFGRLGRRRGWMLLAQLGVIVAILMMSGTDPGADGGLSWTVIWAVALAFASATQDIVIDAYRTEILADERLGAGAATLIFGYRIAMLTSGGGALLIADWWGWQAAYASMAVLMGVGIAAVLVNPEPGVQVTDRSRAIEESGHAWVGRFATLPASARRLMNWIADAVVAPFREFASRPGWLYILAFVALYKYGDALLGTMATPFYLDIGFSLSEIGVITKGFGLAMTLLGAGFGGFLVARYGIIEALLVAGILQAVSNLFFAGLAMTGPSLAMLSVTIAAENLTGGMGTAAFVAYLSSLCNIAYTATQYALLSSLMATARTILASGAGIAAESMGWIWFFIGTTVAAAPGLLLLVWMMRRFPAPPPTGRLAGDTAL